MPLDVSVKDKTPHVPKEYTIKFKGLSTSQLRVLRDALLKYEPDEPRRDPFGMNFFIAGSQKDAAEGLRNKVISAIDQANVRL